MKLATVAFSTREKKDEQMAGCNFIARAAIHGCQRKPEGGCIPGSRAMNPGV
jgi:hypothetical protein